jgi:hypothetical protein
MWKCVTNSAKTALEIRYMLKRLEWTQEYAGAGQRCSICGGFSHASDCELAALLK